MRLRVKPKMVELFVEMEQDRSCCWISRSDWYFIYWKQVLKIVWVLLLQGMSTLKVTVSFWTIWIGVSWLEPSRPDDFCSDSYWSILIIHHILCNSDLIIIFLRFDLISSWRSAVTRVELSLMDHPESNSSFIAATSFLMWFQWLITRIKHLS